MSTEAELKAVWADSVVQAEKNLALKVGGFMANVTETVASGVEVVQAASELVVEVAEAAAEVVVDVKEEVTEVVEAVKSVVAPFMPK